MNAVIKLHLYWFGTNMDSKEQQLTGCFPYVHPCIHIDTYMMPVRNSRCSKCISPD